MNHGTTFPTAGNLVGMTSAVHFDFPSELVSRVFLHLNAASLTRCRLVSRAFNNIITDDLRLQYILKLALHNMVDNPEVKVPIHQKLGSLAQFVERWDKFEWSNPSVINIPPNNFGTFRRFNQGVFVSRGGRAFSCVRTTQAGSQPQSFTITDFPPNQHLGGPFINADQNLLVLVEYQNSLELGIDFTSKVVLYFRSLVDGAIHPQVASAKVVIDTGITEYNEQHCSVVFDKESNHLACLIRLDQADKLNMQLVILDWKTGEIKKDICGPYPGCTFLNSHYLLVCDLGKSRLTTTIRLSVISLDDDSDGLPITSFSYPEVTGRLFSEEFRAAFMNGSSSESNSHPLNRPFHSSGEDAVIVLSLYYAAPYVVRDTDVWRLFSIFPRSGILSMIQPGKSTPNTNPPGSWPEYHTFPAGINDTVAAYGSKVLVGHRGYMELYDFSPRSRRDETPPSPPPFQPEGPISPIPYSNPLVDSPRVPYRFHRFQCDPALRANLIGLQEDAIVFVDSTDKLFVQSLGL
ncbi:hypothetical protein BDN72DRAFT_294284 [Pluteus cervinus]|uniref:Uncharacterized protein n=1 Tax=Pluteus cervinus TaxID=181527 RepID=A0ACD3B3W4_9AGAR|nr:hypothetical protein BDN72DRAFT_294284 [Pluteus cervinus]